MTLAFDSSRNEGARGHVQAASMEDPSRSPADFERGPSARALEQRLAGINVLVVEDEPDAREVVGALLESRGARVVLTASAAEAYVSLEHELPDIILSDIGMPGEDGYQFARRVRTLSVERGGATPIVALTAYASPQDRIRTRDAGYSHHLAKPVDAEELVEVLARLSKRSTPLS